MKNSNAVQSGSLVLMVLILMTAFIIVVHSALRANSYLVLLAQARVTAESKNGSHST
jgi:hypothetical protein